MASHFLQPIYPQTAKRCLQQTPPKKSKLYDHHSSVVLVMNPRSSFCSSLFMFITLLGLHVFFASSQVEDDVRCLRGFKDTVFDPQARLATWRFDNTTSGFICDFKGVSCWNQRENRVLGLELRDMNLSGNKIPEALKYCGKTIQRLDLASNSFTLKIPPEICTWMPFLVSIDLSSNKLSGHIPPTIVNCSYLNELVLSNNELSGSIPSEFGNLNMLKKFYVANNRLRGTIPEVFNGFDRKGFEGNSGLCGGPLGSKCGGKSKKNVIIIVAAGVAGASASLFMSCGLLWWCGKRHGKE